MELSFIQIQCVPVANTSTTQCNVIMYGLDSQGKVWVKTDRDKEWKQESMKWRK